MPWRRSVALTMASPPARNSPLTGLPLRSFAFPLKDEVLGAFRSGGSGHVASSRFGLFVGGGEYFFQRRHPGLTLTRPD